MATLIDTLKRRLSRPRPILSADLRTTNTLLERLCIATERNAHAIETLVREGVGYDISRENLPAEPEAPRKQHEPLYVGDLERDEILAGVEILESEGVEVPLDIYERFQIQPPDHRSLSMDPDPLEEELAQEDGLRARLAVPRLPIDDSSIVTAYSPAGPIEESEDEGLND